jgi:site-specific recombinase XerD
MSDQLVTSDPFFPGGVTLPQGSTADDLLPLYLLKFDRENTRRSYASDLRHFFGSEAILLSQARRVSFVDVNQYLTTLEAGGSKAATLQRKTATIRGFFGWLVALGLLAHNPADAQLVRRTRRSKPQDRVVVALTRDQAQALVRSVDPERTSASRDRALLLTLLYGVLRRSEAAAMDFEHLRQVGPYWVLELPQAKGGADQFVKLPEHVVREIETMREHYGYGPGPVWRSLSRNSHGRRLSPAGIYEVVRTHARRAGFYEQVGAHTLRHTGCTLAVEAGASIQQVQAHARHKQLQTTMIYVHQRDRLRDSAADYIDI